MKRPGMLLAGGFMLMLLPPLQASAASSEQLLNAFNGTILDFDATRIVWKGTDNKVLWLYNREDGSQVKVYDAGGTNAIISVAELSAQGVVYSLTGGSVATRFWKDGSVIQNWDGRTLYKVNGYFAYILRSVDGLIQNLVPSTCLE